MVELGYSAFAVGAVAGWSALFLRVPHNFIGILLGAGLWLAWALLVYGLALIVGAPPLWLLAGAGAGAAGHALLLMLAKRGTMR